MHVDQYKFKFLHRRCEVLY